MDTFLAQGSVMARSKICFKCNIEKDLSEFYPHPAMADGHLNKCKTCAKLDAGKHRSENLEKVREYDRERGKTPERLKLNMEVTKAWRAQDRRRVQCHNAVSRAIK